MTAARATDHTDLIYDVGLHRGEDTEFYLRKGFRVVAIEALPALASAVCERKHDAIAEGRLVVVNAAVGDRPGRVDFYVNANSNWGTTSSAWAARNGRLGSPPVETITVDAVDFASVLADHGVPYYLKLDVEGADSLCLQALEAFPERPFYLSLESDKQSWAGLRQEFDLLARLGYTRFKVVPQHKVGRQTPPTPPREGHYVAHVFEPHASGLFGEEAPGRWLTRRQALRRYRLIFVRYRLWGFDGVLRRRGLHTLARILTRLVDGPNGAAWYDTHAALPAAGRRVQR